MPQTKSQKQEIERGLSLNVERQNAMVFVDYTGLGVKEMNTLRFTLKENNASLQVVKKTLLSRVFDKKKISISLSELMGQLGIIFAYGDPISAIKDAHAFAKKEEHINILGGYMDQQFFGVIDMQKIASLPTREILLQQLLGTIVAPMSGLARVLQENTRGLLTVLSQRAKTL